MSEWQSLPRAVKNRSRQNQKIHTLTKAFFSCILVYGHVRTVHPFAVEVCEYFIVSIRYFLFALNFKNQSIMSKFELVKKLEFLIAFQSECLHNGNWKEFDIVENEIKNLEQKILKFKE